MEGKLLDTGFDASPKIKDLIAKADETPFMPGATPTRPEDYLQLLGDEHTLFCTLHFNPATERYFYHVSLSRARGQAEPFLGISVAILFGFMAELGMPTQFRLEENVLVYFFDKPADASEPPPLVQH